MSSIRRRSSCSSIFVSILLCTAHWHEKSNNLSKYLYHLCWWGEVNWLFNATINDISVIYVTAHRWAGGLKKLDLRLGSQRHRHFVGFFNMPVQALIRLFLETAPFSRLLRHAGDTEDTFSTKPPGSPRGIHVGWNFLGIQDEITFFNRKIITYNESTHLPLTMFSLIL